MVELGIGEICEIVKKSAEEFSDKPGRGMLIFVEVEEVKLLHKLAIKLAEELSDKEPIPIYVVQGAIGGEYNWPFHRIKIPPRIKLMTDGSMVIEESGLIFPQDKPIILLAEYFDCFEQHDQRAYSHLVDGEGGEFSLHSGSVLIAGLVSGNRGKLEPGAATRGLHFKLVEHP